MIRPGLLRALQNSSRTTLATKPSLRPLLLRSMSATANGRAKPNLPVADRMHTGRAMAQDVWSIYNAANLPADCINLGQGYMNFSPPQWIKDAADTALATTIANHYSHPKGRVRLREAIRDHYSPEFTNLGRPLDIESEILVTSGANEGQYSMFTAFLNPGDEVIMFEPFFDQYLPSVTFNAGVPVYVPLHPPKGDSDKPTSGEWTIDFDELRRSITPKTKMIIVNTPHNPVGKVFTRSELEKIAALYDCLVFDDKEHVRIATLPGMWDRTVTVGSAGKSFAATGWRIGWLIGPPALIGPTLAATTRIVFCTNSPLQEAAAAGLEQANKRNFFETQRKEYKSRRDVLLSAFNRLGLRYTVPEASLDGRGKDFKASWFIAQELGVSTIPVSEVSTEAYIRFAFCKDEETLKLAGERLAGLTKYLA
ncbi:aminotransferase [Rhizoctonia solani AG-1 IA]|uniref:Aminotransferase n=1 Tax=Thanatephorus cucumeris (strain AG1-IA) TaxID=983506 RepID=L8X6F6_THACA|nr:aminotransferase [Rhizoctonia solani AG-1 IA]